MQISFQMTDDILIATASGELDHHSAALVRDEIDKTMDAFQCKNLILDLSQLTFMDSSGIGVVLGRYNKIKEKEGKLYVSGCTQHVEKILYMAGVFSVAPMKANVEDAIGAIKGEDQIEMEGVRSEE